MSEDFDQLQVIGKGRLAAVILARARASSRRVAIKRYDKHTLGDRRHRALAELAVLRSVHHPFLVSFVAAFEDESAACIAMELAEGGDLFSLIEQRPRGIMPVNGARFYAAEIACALEWLHLHGIIHRDVKPENVLIAASGHIRLADFDQAARIPDTADWPRSLAVAHLARSVPLATTGSHLVGTPEYLAPEVLLHGPVAYSEAVDWWALGCTIYAMLVGSTPFGGHSKRRTLEAIVAHAQVPAHFADVLPEPARHLLVGLLAADPARRLEVATSMREHTFFENLNWALIRHQIAPYPPPGIIPVAGPPPRAAEASRCPPSALRGLRRWPDLPGRDRGRIWPAGSSDMSRSAPQEGRYGRDRPFETSREQVERCSCMTSCVQRLAASIRGSLRRQHPLPHAYDSRRGTPFASSRRRSPESSSTSPVQLITMKHMDPALHTGQAATTSVRLMFTRFLTELASVGREATGGSFDQPLLGKPDWGGQLGPDVSERPRSPKVLAQPAREFQ